MLWVHFLCLVKKNPLVEKGVFRSFYGFAIKWW